MRQLLARHKVEKVPFPDKKMLLTVDDLATVTIEVLAVATGASTLVGSIQ